MSLPPPPALAPQPVRGDVLPPRKDRTAADVEAVRREGEELGSKLTIVVFIRVILVSVSLVVMFLFAQMRVQSAYTGTWQYALVSLTYALTLVYSLLLRFSRAMLPLAYAQIVLDTVVVSALVFMTGGIESVFTFAYVLTVLGASITLYRRGAILAGLCYFLMFGTVILVQVDPHLGLLPGVDFGHAMFSFLMHASSIVLVGVLSSMLTEQLRVAGRRLAEKQSDYERLEELHAAILRSLPAGLMTIDPDGMIRYANEAALGILRSSPEAVVGHPLASVVPAMAARWAADGSASTEEGVSRQRYEATHMRRDGRGVRLGFSFAPLGPNAGSEWGSIAVFQDVTEIVRLKNAYERAERLATVGKMAAGLAHEVRNPLASVCASIDVMKQALDPPEPMKRLMTNIVREADRLNGLITDFLEFARPRPPNKKRTDLSALVGGVVDVFKNDKILSVCTLDVSLANGLFASIDADQVRQVIWNLARNAAEAMNASPAPGPKKLTVSTRKRGEAAEVSIQDTGPGIDPEQLKRIFDPFFTTKERGSGLGLAITHSIVETHGGRILVESKPGEGTEVTVAFPFDEEGTVMDVETFRGSASDADLLGGTLDAPRITATRSPRS